MLRQLLCVMMMAATVSCGDSKTSVSSSPGETQVNSTDSTSSKSASKLEYEKMLQVLSLSEAEAIPLKAAFDEGDAAIQAWQARHGSELQRLEEQMKSAAKSQNLAGVRDATSKAKPLRDELVQLARTHHEKILSSLSPGKRIQWDGYLLAEKLLELMQPLALRAEQRKAVADHAVAAARTVARAGQPGDTMAGAFLKLERSVEQEVLTPQQRADYGLIKKKHPLRSLSW
ncbi:MAG: hypothetical protein V2A74_04660 [bacterium]